MKKDIIDLLRMLEDKGEEVGKIFYCGEWLDDEISVIWDILEKEYCPNGFTEDQYDALYNFGIKKITKEQLVKKLKK